MRAIVVLVALVLVPSATAAQVSRVVDSQSVGGYRITQSRARAIDVFGAPTYSVDSHNFNLPQGENARCRTHWRSLGLTISYLGECSLPGRAWRITVEGDGWRTREWLRIGDRAARITRVYRGAKVTRGPDAATVTRWSLTPLGVEWDLRRARPSSAVIVATQSGRVVGFELRRL
jgi:hypothetical protein